jgi:hypothetical protein
MIAKGFCHKYVAINVIFRAMLLFNLSTQVFSRFFSWHYRSFTSQLLDPGFATSRCQSALGQQLVLLLG